MDEARERSRRVFPHAATEIGSQMGGAALSESLGQQTFVTVLACWRRLNKVSGTNGSWTLRWREMDSNFQYAGAVNLFVAPFVVPGCLKSPPATRSRRKRQGPFQGSPGPAPPCTRGCGWRVGWNGPARSSRRLSPLSLLLLPISLRFGRRASIICCEAFRRLHPQPSTERAAAPVQAMSKAGSLRRLPILPKQPGASKGATTSFTAPAY